MDDSFLVIEVIEEDESEELIEAAEPVEIFEWEIELLFTSELFTNWWFIEELSSDTNSVAGKDKSSSKVSEEREVKEDTESQSWIDKFKSSAAWIGDNIISSIMLEDGRVCFFFFTGGSNSTIR